MGLYVLILVNFITGSACLIFGVNMLTGGLERSGKKIAGKAIEMLSGNVLKSFLVGTILTALLQSSTAVMVITVGLVGSGMMPFASAVGIIYGANVGTTITAQLMSFNIEFLGFPILAVGLLLKLFNRFAKHKNKKYKYKNLEIFSDIITGLGLLFTGLQVIHSGVPLLKESPIVYGIFEKYSSHPVLAILIGTIATMLVQSSSATIGVTIVLFNSGLINLVTGVGLILGDNIGTCATAQIVSLGMGTAAKRTAWAHTIYNIIGSLIALIMLNPFIRLVTYFTLLFGDETRLVANAHSIFNIMSALVFLPLTKYYVKLIEWIIPEQPRKDIRQAVSDPNAPSKVRRNRLQFPRRSV